MINWFLFLKAQTTSVSQVSHSTFEVVKSKNFIIKKKGIDKEFNLRRNSPSPNALEWPRSQSIDIVEAKTLPNSPHNWWKDITPRSSLMTYQHRREVLSPFGSSRDVESHIGCGWSSFWSLPSDIFRCGHMDPFLAACAFFSFLNKRNFITRKGMKNPQRWENNNKQNNQRKKEN